MVPLIFTLSALICSSYVNAAEADNIHSSSKHKVHEVKYSSSYFSFFFNLLHISHQYTRFWTLNPNQISSRLLSEITVHGFLLWASFGFLMPIALLVMRTSKKEECGRRLKILVYTHATLQVCLSMKILVAFWETFPFYITFLSWMFNIKTLFFLCDKQYLNSNEKFIITNMNLLDKPHSQPVIIVKV